MFSMGKIVKKLIILGMAVITFGCLSPCTTLADGPFGFGDTWGAAEVKVPGSSKNQKDSLIHTIQTAINRLLGLLSAISLVLCLYAGFKMLTSGGDSKKYGEGFSILKSAALGLAIIGTSWLIVSLIFFIINGSIQLEET